MKIWIKYLLGIFLGLAAAFILPYNNPAVTQLLAAASEFSIRFGRYFLLPVLFFGIAVAVFKLRDTKMLGKTALWTAGTIAGTTLILTLLGLLSILIIKLPRIPITGEKITDIPGIPLRTIALMIFPYSGFDALKEGVFLLPCFIFAGFAGAGCTSDQITYKPVISFFEAAAKLSKGEEEVIEAELEAILITADNVDEYPDYYVEKDTLTQEEADAVRTEVGE